MSRTNGSAPTGEHTGTGAGGEEVSFLQVGAIVLRHWKTIVGVTVGATLAAFAFSFLKPDVYTSRTVLLMQQEGDARLQGLASQFPFNLPGMNAGAGRSGLVSAVLKSRSLTDSLSARVGSAQKVEVEQDVQGPGTIRISVTDRDPEKAARIASGYAEAVNGMVADLNTQTALRKQALLQRQLDFARTRLDGAEQRMVEFQQRRDVPEIQDQARMTLAAAVELQSQIREAEIQITQLRRTATPDNPELRRLVAEVGARREQLRRMTSGREDTGVLPGLRESPELKAASLRLMREFTEAEALYNSLSASLAQSQITITDDLPLLTVLDPALVPSAPSGPNRKLAMVLGGILGLVAGLGVAFMREYGAVARRDPKNAAFFAEWDGIKSGLSGVVPGRRARRTRMPVGS
jgi:tyrosine-protein kinase Etk/Wzc